MKFSILILMILALSGCGKSNPSGTGVVNGGTAVPQPGCTSNCGPSFPTGTNPAHRYEFTLYGDQYLSVNSLSTDNVLRLKFHIPPGQGNHFHQADELKVSILVNGVEVVPTYTGAGYVYGKVGETSNVIDLSQYITPGQPLRISVRKPMNNFYCTYRGAYIGENPLYFPNADRNHHSCKKAVFVNRRFPQASHVWSGVLIVQTSSTLGI